MNSPNRLIVACLLLLSLFARGDVAPPPKYRVIDLGTLGGTQSYATAINNKGQAVGDSTTKDGSTHAFLFSLGKMTDLGVIAGVDRGDGRGLFRKRKRDCSRQSRDKF